MGNTANVTTGKPKAGGSVFVAPAGTTPPTDALSTLADTFKNLGYSSEDGLTNEGERETEEIKSWDGDVILQPQTSKTDTFGLTLVESLDTNVLKVVYGDDNVSGDITSGITVKVNANELPYTVWVIDQITNGDNLKRIVIPNAKVTEVGEITYKPDEAVGYEITITAFPDSDGNTHYEYIQAPAAA